MNMRNATKEFERDEERTYFDNVRLPRLQECAKDAALDRKNRNSLAERQRNAET